MRQLKFFIKYKLEIFFFAFFIMNVWFFSLFLKSNPLILKSMPDFTTMESSVQPLIKDIPVEKGAKNKLRKNFSINLSCIEDFLYYAPKNNMKASEILILKVNNADHISSVKKSIEDHIEKLMKSFQDYAPEESFILEKHLMKVRGNYIFYISAQNSSEILKNIDETFLYK